MICNILFLLSNEISLTERSHILTKKYKFTVTNSSSDQYNSLIEEDLQPTIWKIKTYEDQNVVTHNTSVNAPREKDHIAL